MEISNLNVLNGHIVEIVVAKLEVIVKNMIELLDHVNDNCLQ